MTCWVVIPAKNPAEAKGRLAATVAADRRRDLALAMLKRALKAAGEAGASGGIVVVGSLPPGLSDSAVVIAEPGGGLNAAVTHARTVIAQRGGSRIVTLAADLPSVTADDVRALCQLPAGIVGLAPDHHGTGTNALSLPLPEALDFAYAYGPGSCARHLAEARRLGLDCRLIETPGLARDIDEPADLDGASALLAGLKGRS